MTTPTIAEPKPPGRTRAFRRDALERREALLVAAAACFAERGFGVPLEDIADRAGVGRGTLYRNFRDRMSLVLAIFERRIAGVEAIVAPDRPFRETLVEMIRQGTDATWSFARLATEMPPSGDDLAAFETLGRHLDELVSPLVERALMAGEIRAGTTPAQVVLAMRMVSGLLLPIQSEEQMRETIDHAVDLVMGGMAPDGRDD